MNGGVGLRGPKISSKSKAPIAKGINKLPLRERGAPLRIDIGFWMFGYWMLDIRSWMQDYSIRHV
jgi:hypothetical protein